MSGRPIRVLHCPDVVGGNAPALALAERRLGLVSKVVAFEESLFGYSADEFLWRPGDSRWRREWKRWQLFWRAWRDYDIIHFNFGRSLMPMTGPRGQTHGLARFFDLYPRLFEMLDVAFLKRAGKGIVVTFQGDDARQGDYCLRNFAITMAREVEPGYYSAQTDAAKRRRIALFNRYADRMYALNPDLLHVLPARAEFLPYTSIDLRHWQSVPPCQGTSPPTIVHAPSNRGVKGTRYLLEAVERLRHGGIPFQFILVEGLARDAARKLYERADLVVDQLLSGWYGGLAVELMALGKPVMCHLRDADLHFLPAAMRADMPIIPVTPASVYEVLRTWITRRRPELASLGCRSRAFVEKWHDPAVVARKVKEDYEAILVRKGYRAPEPRTK